MLTDDARKKALDWVDAQIHEATMGNELNRQAPFEIAKDAVESTNQLLGILHTLKTALAAPKPAKE